MSNRALEPVTAITKALWITSIEKGILSKAEAIEKIGNNVHLNSYQKKNLIEAILELKA